jgi:glutaredoxin-like protein NrdH
VPSPQGSQVRNTRMRGHKAVRMFTLSTCGHCRAARKLLEDLGVEYQFTDVDLLQGRDQLRAVNELRKINRRLTFPTIVIGDRVIIGNREEEIREALGVS